MSSHDTELAPMVTCLAKIERIRKAPLTEAELSSQRSTKSPISSLTQMNYLNIFKNLTILYIGDPSIRILFRDLCKVLKYGRLLDYTEAACANGEYRCMEGNADHECIEGLFVFVS
jgi:hypothetical protein